MRRSLAPSKRLSTNPILQALESKVGKDFKDDQDEENNEITISRLPMFGFLTIPDSLNKQFKVPSGCRVTKEAIALRKIKTLGPNRNIPILRPGDSLRPITRPQSLETSIDDDNEEEGMPTAVIGLPSFDPLILWRDPNKERVIEVIPELCSKLRPHQREGVQFLFECTMGLRGFDGQGCILADDMGLGKTFMSITLIWTLMNQGFVEGRSAVRKVIVACPTSLVGNWDNEIKRWVGDKCNTFPVKSEPKIIIRNFLQHRGKGVLIISYETLRRYIKQFESAYKAFIRSNQMIANNTKPSMTDDEDCNLHEQPSTEPEYNGVCELLICDEAHKLKNAESGLSSSLSTLPAKKRILLSGTPMQNELGEFFNMVNFCNPMVLGTPAEFRRRFERPILRALEPDASDRDVNRAKELQTELSTIVNEFILKRGNILNAKHLPPKLVQFVCCRLTDLQEKMTHVLLNSKEMRAIRDGKQTNTLNCIRQLINICSHPQLIMETYIQRVKNNEKIDEDMLKLVELVQSEGGGNKGSNTNKSKVISSNSKGSYVNPELSGKLLVLHRLMSAMRALKQNERIVIVSNYTSTLDLIEQMCLQENWPVLRLDGTTGGTKRTQLVDKFNDRLSGAFAFLLSSKAGGCGINLIGGNRLVLFDPDWNPASDKQAAGRIWREGQQKRCFIYRFMSTGTIEEKIIQRQLSKEGLQNIVDDTDQVNQISSTELKRLFSYRGQSTRSDTHDTLKCLRCRSVAVHQSSSSKLSIDQMNICGQFIDEFMVNVTKKSLEMNPWRHQRPNETDTIDSSIPSLATLNQLKNDLFADKFDNLQLFSKKLRYLVTSIDRDPYLLESESRNDISEENASKQTEDVKPLEILKDFLSKWSEIVHTLSSLSFNSSRMRQSKDYDENNGGDLDDEYVEQEGCPEETDFNKWSHHCSVNSVDDDVLKKAMSDDNTISFLFGLEVNYELLQRREELKKLELADKRRSKEMNQEKDSTPFNADCDLIDPSTEQDVNDKNNDQSVSKKKKRANDSIVSKSKKTKSQRVDEATAHAACDSDNHIDPALMSKKSVISFSKADETQTIAVDTYKNSSTDIIIGNKQSPTIKNRKKRVICSDDEGDMNLSCSIPVQRTAVESASINVSNWSNSNLRSILAKSDSLHSPLDSPSKRQKHVVIVDENKNLNMMNRSADEKEPSKPTDEGSPPAIDCVPQTWACEICTFENVFEFGKECCDVCSSLIPDQLRGLKPSNNKRRSLAISKKAGVVLKGSQLVV